MYVSGPYKGYGAVPAALGNGNGAKPNGEYKHVRIHNTAVFYFIFKFFSGEISLKIDFKEFRDKVFKFL